MPSESNRVGAVVRAQETLEGAGFRVQRPFPSPSLSLIDPFLLLDEMGPSEHAPGEAKGAPDHPHRGFETVTYMLAGAFEHRDSAGNQGRLDPGDVQWMTAGSGVVHSEMPAADLMEHGGRLHGLQLWVNLPAADKMVPPRYQDTRAARIPEVSTGPTSRVRVIAGRFRETEAVIGTHTPILYQHHTIGPGERVGVTVPEDHQGFAYTLDGAGAVNATPLPDAHLAVIEPGAGGIELTSADDGEPWSVLLAAGRPLGEPVARYGPFVMNSEAEIRQAFQDYHAGRFGQP